MNTNKIETTNTKKTWEVPVVTEINKSTILNQPGNGGDGGVAGATLT